MSWKCFLGLVLMCFLWNRTHNNGIHELDKSLNMSSSFCLLRLFSRCCIFGTDLHSPEHSYWQVVRGLMCWNVFRKTANSGPSLLSPAWWSVSDWLRVITWPGYWPLIGLLCCLQRDAELVMTGQWRRFLRLHQLTLTGELAPLFPDWYQQILIFPVLTNS